MSTQDPKKLTETAETFEDTPDERLEFNDGVGDMLRPREKDGFGWFSTLLIIALSVLVIIISFWISFNVGKKIFLKEAPAPKVESPLWEEVPATPENAAPPATAPAAEKAPAEELLPPSQPSVKPVENVAPPVPAVKPVPAQVAPALKPQVQNVQAQNKPVPPAPKPAPVVTIPKPTVPAPRPAAVVPIAKPSKVLMRVIAGSFSDAAGAQQLANMLTQKGIPSFVWAHALGDKTVYRVQAGAFGYAERAEAMVSHLKNLGYDAYIMQ